MPILYDKRVPKALDGCSMSYLHIYVHIYIYIYIYPLIYTPLPNSPSDFLALPHGDTAVAREQHGTCPSFLLLGAA